MQLFCLKARQEEILQSRMIKEAQDLAFAESLRVDREREKPNAEVVCLYILAVILYYNHHSKKVYFGNYVYCAQVMQALSPLSGPASPVSKVVIIVLCST